MVDPKFQGKPLRRGYCIRSMRRLVQVHVNPDVTAHPPCYRR